MSHYAVMLYSIGAAAIIAFGQMWYSKQAKPDLLIMAVVGLLFLGSGAAAHFLLAEASA